MQKFYRYGIAADKKVFEASPSFVDGLVIPGHLAVDQPSLGAFIRKLKKPYVVDPMTFAFALDEAELLNEQGDDLKRSYRKLVKAIVWPAKTDFARGARVRPQLFPGTGAARRDAIDAFVKSVLAVQDRSATDQQDLDDLNKLAKMMKKTGKPLAIDPDEMASRRPPAFKIAPYFFFDAQADPWFKLNREFLESAKRLEPDGQVYAVVAIGAQVLGSSGFEWIREEYKAADGYVVWVDGFWEYTQSADALVKLRALYNTLNAGGKPVFSLYGSIFQSFLAEDGLVAFSSGLGYGDSKSRVSATGGLPAPRYFTPRLFQNLVREDLLPYLQSMQDVACVCDICSGLKKNLDLKLAGWPEKFLTPTFFPRPGPPGSPTFASGEQQQALRTHFIQCMGNEMQRLSSLEGNELARELVAQHQRIDQRNRVFARHYAGHLLRWAQALAPPEKVSAQ